MAVEIKVNRKIQNIARLCHEANRSIQIFLGEKPNPHWDELDVELKNSTYAGVLYALDGLTPEQLHERWRIHKAEDGWVFGPTKDFERKTHPCMVPYNALPVEQRLKDQVFATIVRTYRR